MLSSPMLRTSLRAKSLAVSFLVHGAAAATLALAVSLPGPRGGGAPREFRMAAREAVEPLPDAPPPEPEHIEPPEEPVELPPPLDVPDTELPVAEPEVPVEPLVTAPELLDPDAPFEGMHRSVDLRPAPRATTPEVASTADVVPPATPAPRAADEVAPPVTEVAPGPPTSAPAPLPGAAPTPDYPESWARRGWHGEVTIELDVATDGTVSAARVVVSSGYPRLDELARSTLATWRFAPASEGGVAVAGTFRQRVEFRPR